MAPPRPLLEPSVRAPNLCRWIVPLVLESLSFRALYGLLAHSNSGEACAQLWTGDGSLSFACCLVGILMSAILARLAPSIYGRLFIVSELESSVAGGGRAQVRILMLVLAHWPKLRPTLVDGSFYAIRSRVLRLPAASESAQIMATACSAHRSLPLPLSLI